MTSAFGQPGQWGSTFSPEQQKAIKSVLDMFQNQSGNGGSDITQSGGYQTGLNSLMGMFNNQDFYKQFEAPIMRQFEEQIAPDVANRFGGMGTGGSFGSGFQNQMAREASNLSTNLGALRGGMQMQAIPQLLQYSQQPFQNMMSLFQGGTQNGTNNIYQPATMGWLGPLLASLGGGLAGGAGMGFGNSMAKNFM